MNVDKREEGSDMEDQKISNSQVNEFIRRRDAEIIGSLNGTTRIGHTTAQKQIRSSRQSAITVS